MQVIKTVILFENKENNFKFVDWMQNWKAFYNTNWKAEADFFYLEDIYTKKLLDISSLVCVCVCIYIYNKIAIEVHGIGSK